MDGQENIEGRLDGQTNGWQDGYKKPVVGWTGRNIRMVGLILKWMAGWSEKIDGWMNKIYGWLNGQENIE